MSPEKTKERCPHCDGAGIQRPRDDTSIAATPRSRRFRGSPLPLGESSALPSLYGTNFRHSLHIARLRRLSNGATVSAADGSQEDRLGRGSGQIGKAKAARIGAASGGARPLLVRTSARDQAPASSPDAASLLRRRLLHSGYARDAQPRHLLSQVSARACWRAKVHMRMCLYPPREATIAHAPSQVVGET